MIADTKNGDPLTLPMSDYVFELLLRRQKISSEDKFVFPGPGKEGCLAEPKKGIQKVIDETDIEFSCHDLRRTFITIAESLEVSSYALKKLINHRVTDVTGGYIIMNVDRLRKPVDQISRFILEQVREDVCRLRPDTCPRAA